MKPLKDHLRLLVRPLSVHVWIFEIYLETQSFNFDSGTAINFHADTDAAIRIDADVNPFFSVT